MCLIMLVCSVCMLVVCIMLKKCINLKCECCVILVVYVCFFEVSVIWSMCYVCCKELCNVISKWLLGIFFDGWLFELKDYVINNFCGL